MRIGVPREIKQDEYRVAITPAGVIATRYSSSLTSHGTPILNAPSPGRAEPAKTRSGHARLRSRAR